MNYTTPTTTVQFGGFGPNILELMGSPYDRSLQDIAKGICHKHGITMRQLRGPKSPRKIGMPRHAFFLEAHTHGHTQADIAKFVGRDPSTVLYGIERAKERLGK